METTITENQMEKKMENEMETGIIIRGTLTGKHLRRHSDPKQGLSLKALTGSFEPLVWGSPLEPHEYNEFLKACVGGF